MKLDSEGYPTWPEDRWFRLWCKRKEHARCPVIHCTCLCHIFKFTQQPHQKIEFGNLETGIQKEIPVVDF